MFIVRSMMCYLKNLSYPVLSWWADLTSHNICRSDSGLDFALSIANDIMDIDFEGAADVDIGSLDDDLDFFSTDKYVAPKAVNGSVDQWSSGQVCLP